MATTQVRWAGVALLLAAATTALSWDGRAPARASGPIPIQHVVVIYQENHSFNDVLGSLCERGTRCTGTSVGRLPGGRTVPLARARDIVAQVEHTTQAQLTAMDGGRMDGFSRIGGCSRAANYGCYVQYRPSDIPNLSALAQDFTISDRTFEMSAVPSWGAHLELVAGTLDRFVGDNPARGDGPGWGCDSHKDAGWIDPSTRGLRYVPACVPAPDGSGPYRPSPVQWVPTIMDRLDGAGLSWRIYAPGSSEDVGAGAGAGYGWAICPTFAECLNGPQASNETLSSQVVQDAAQGSLPNLSIVIPGKRESQHNGNSMLAGDNWIGSVVSSVMTGPEWNSTAIFITYDDCGCFYDPVRPPPGLGIRVPMVIVSPYAKQSFTDHHTASFASMLAFTEHVFGLPPLSSTDARAYNFLGSFDFGRAPRGAIPLRRHRVPAWERRWIRAHPDTSGDNT